MSTVRTFLIEPFDIMLHATEEGVQSLQARFSTWLRTLREPARLAELMHFQTQRARDTYRDAFALLPAQDRRAQRPGLIMASIYYALLVEIERDGFKVMHQRIALTPLRKLWQAWKVQALGRM